MMSKLPDLDLTDCTVADADCTQAVANLAEAEIVLRAVRWEVQPDNNRAF